MKIARASEQDLDVALKTSSLIESLELGYMPNSSDDDAAPFDIDDLDQCQAVVQRLLDINKGGSIFRVTFGMSVVLAPANKLLDPNADTLECHPDISALKANAEAAAKKLRSAEICHPRAVETLVNEARQILAPYLPAGWPEQREDS
jgi:hypothetical protein